MKARTPGRRVGSRAEKPLSHLLPRRQALAPHFRPRSQSLVARDLLRVSLDNLSELPAAHRLWARHRLPHPQDVLPKCAVTVAVTGSLNPTPGQLLSLRPSSPAPARTLPGPAGAEDREISRPAEIRQLL